MTSERPERTWIDWPQLCAVGLAYSCQARPPALHTEYVRADLVDAEIARLTAALKEAESRGYDMAKEQAAKLAKVAWLQTQYGSITDADAMNGIRRDRRERPQQKTPLTVRRGVISGKKP